jgi:hypothetical protein
VQLTFVATILKRVFAAQNIWTVAAIARTSYTSIFLPVAHSRRTGTPVLLELLGTFETGAFLSHHPSAELM